MSDTQTADAPNTIAPVTIDVVSDVVCPWCFIGKRRLEKALALKPNIPVEVRFHPYFLNPWVPREGMARDEYLTTKFGSPDKLHGHRRAGRRRRRRRRPDLRGRQDAAASPTRSTATA